MSDKNKAAGAAGASALAFEPSGSSAASFAPALVTEPNAPITLRNFDALVAKPALDLRSVLLDSSALVPVRDIGMLGGPLVPNPKLDIVSILFSGERARTEAAAARQWHIANTTPSQFDLNIGTIWDDYTGRGVRIGVYDTGIESTHPDLNDNYNARLEFAGDNPGPDAFSVSTTNITIPGIGGLGGVTIPIPVLIPTPDGDAHGTAVAGIIAAEQNGSGTVGIAYGARITSVDTVGAATVSNWADFEAGMARFDIVNRSSGTSTQFQGDADNFADYENAVMTGRGGRGTIIVESANNDRVYGELGNNLTQESTDAGRGDAGADSANNGHFAIVVGSVDQNGRVDSYSNPGANILVSAFGTAGNANSVVTTDLVGTNGYRTTPSQPSPNEINGGDYTSTFNGTSAATPMVSGIVALMLEANPMLGWRDVQNILALSARQAVGQNGAGPTAATPERFGWVENRADNWNGGGMHFSNDYGYGLVDAHAAVRLAESWTLQSNSSNQQVGVGTWFGNQVTLTEANTVPNEFRFTITDDISTESIGLWMNLQHQRMSDLKIEIRSPEGTWSTLTDRTGLGGIDYAITGNEGWTFYSNAFRGEQAQGDWVVRIWDQVDADAGTPGAMTDDGTVSQLILRTYGAADTVNDQLYYTDEYGKVWSDAMAAGNFGRLQITDTDGGIDTINASATSTEAVINLEQGGITLIAGGYAQVAMGSVIENAFGGDGNDTLHGNAEYNLLDGNRGNDTLYGKGGRDSLSGDNGDDFLVGGALGDHINGGSGKDTASYEGSRRGVTVSLGDQQGGVWNGTATGGDATGDRLYYIENVTGSRWGDTLTGNAGDNVLNGGLGADKMWGGRGDDTYYVDNASDRVDETEYVGSSGGSGMLRFSGYRDTGGTDTVVTTLATYDLSDVGANIPSLRALFPDTLYGTIENLTYSGTSSFTGTGNTADNVIRGGSASDALAGGEGHDTLYGGLGNDGLDLGLGNDKAYIDNGTAEGGDVVDASAGGYDSVYADDSTAASGLRLNLWAAGTGYTPDVNKVAFTSSAIGVDYVEGNAGNDVIDGSRLSEGIVIAGGRGDDTLIGGSGSDGLIGGDNNDTLRGGLGNDGFDLGLGNDDAYIDNGTAEGGDVVYGTEGGYDTVYADDNTRATGLRLNLFRAGTGYTADVNRVALTSAAIAIDKVVGNTGNDLVDASRLAAGDYVEFAGGAGDDTLLSGLGSERFDGETDVDTIVYDGARTDYVIGTLEIRGGRSVVTIEHTASGATDYLRNVERAIFRSGGAETVVELDQAVGRNIVGTEAGETLAGTELGDTIDARGGNDTLIGAAGADTLLGAAGEDILIVDNADAKIDGGEGYDYVAADASTAAEGFRIDLAGTNVEYVDGSSGGDTFDASGAVTGTLVEINGNAGNDTAREGPVEVWYDGGEGTDTFVLAGNRADYTLHADDGGWAGWTMIVHNATGAVDWTIGVENLQFADQTIADPTAARHVLGTDAADILAGTDGMDTLRGGLGADELRGGAGNDALYVDNTDIVIDGGEGWDVVYVNEAANQSGLTLEMAGKNVEYVWSGLGNDSIDTRGLENKANFWYGVESHAGDDTVLAGDAAISFSGGAGRDKLVLSGNRADYDIGVPQPDVDSTAVTVTNKATGVVDWIYSVETLQFADNTYATRELLV